MEHDRVDVFKDVADEWRWRRVAANQESIAVSGEGYHNLRDCYTALLRVNAKPYVLTVHGDFTELDISQGVIAETPSGDE